MAETVMGLRLNRVVRLGIIAGAILLTSFSAMLHGSAVRAQLQGPDVWAVRVVLDLVLAVNPIVVPVFTFGVLRISGLGRRASVDFALVTWLILAFVSCVLYAFWI